MAWELQTGHDIDCFGGSMSCEAVSVAVLMSMGLVTLLAWEPNPKVKDLQTSGETRRAHLLQWSAVFFYVILCLFLTDVSLRSTATASDKLRRWLADAKASVPRPCLWPKAMRAGSSPLARRMSCASATAEAAPGSGPACRSPFWRR